MRIRIHFQKLLMFSVLFCICTTSFAACLKAQQATYFPQRGEWETREAADVGMNPDSLDAAVALAIESENLASKNLREVVAVAFAGEPHNEIVGPTRPRGPASGLIVRRGYIVAEWGDTRRVEMTFSVTKSYLSTIAALAVDSGMIRDVHDPVRDYVREGGEFTSTHNSAVTWHHLLQQTSDWSGTLWDKPDWADRPVGDDRDQWVNRPLNEPGTSWKYNDVRVNLLAFSLLQVFREPLPSVLRKRIMDPIGASTTWRWHGYRNSWVELDGARLQSVSGGGHWGGGMFISTRDHARFGYLFLREGKWGDKQLVSPEWIEAATTPCPVKKEYGYMWWLNTDLERIPSAPASSFHAAGFGGNYIYVDRENDLLIVLRWTPNLAEVVKKVLDAIEK